MDALSELCRWYERQSVNDWQEDKGIAISSLDNPGWSLKIDLKDTDLQDEKFSSVDIKRSDRDWVVARRNDLKFEAFGGPGNLHEMISTFIAWTQQP